MKPIRTAAVLAALVGLFLGLLVAAPAQAKVKITPLTFGIHSFSTEPRVPAGSIRLNCFPSWRQIEPQQNQFNWGIVDLTLKRVEQWGYTDIQFVFCGTPQWAAGKVRHPRYEVFGKGSTAAPRNLSDWRDFVTRLVQRYKGRIDSYQAWNEITSEQFYQGTAKQMAAMTVELNKIVQANDPSALVVSASVQTHQPTWFRRMAVPYLRGLKAAKWPVDVFAGHFYPAGKGGPDQRMKQIALFNKTLRKLRAPKRPRWDTEANFWTGVKGNPKAGRVRGVRAATYVARNYLDSWRTGVARSYWYLWSHTYMPFPGVQLRKGDPGTRAYATLANWTVGATFSRCRTKRGLVLCGFRKASPFVIAFTTSGKARLKVAGTKTLCPVTGARCRKVRGRATITTVPVRIG